MASLSRVSFFFFFKQKTAYDIMPSLVGSEMCIRDSHGLDGVRAFRRRAVARPGGARHAPRARCAAHADDAATGARSFRRGGDHESQPRSGECLHHHRRGPGPVPRGARSRDRDRGGARRAPSQARRPWLLRGPRRQDARGLNVLREIHVRDLALVEDVWLEFGDGLTVLTGETGAGKTVLVEALKLLLGDRADSTLVRTGAAEAVVEGRLSVDGV